MSKIEFRNDSSVFAVTYRQILQEKINVICKKIGFDDFEVTWVIYDPKDEQSKMIEDVVLVGIPGKDYGYTILEQKKIYISILAMRKNINQGIYDSVKKLGGICTQDDFLANVIIDEITHIQTGVNHGEERYDKKFRENLWKYYNQ